MTRRNLLSGLAAGLAALCGWRATTPLTVYDMAWVLQHGTIRVYDANGVERKYLTRCVVETGECTQLIRDSKGFVLDASHTEIARHDVVYPAPLRVERA